MEEGKIFVSRYLWDAKKIPHMPSNKCLSIPCCL